MVKDGGVLYSDVVMCSIFKFPGEKVIDTATDSPTTRTSTEPESRERDHVQD